MHCYAHQLNLIMQQATSRIKKVNVFFSDLSGIASFFSRSPKRCSRAFWTRLFHEDCPELHLQGGILTAGSSTLCSRTEMTSLNILKPSRRVHMVHLTSSAWERHLATWGCYRTKTSFFSCVFFTTSCPTSTCCTRSSRRRTLIPLHQKGPRELHKQCADH